MHARRPASPWTRGLRQVLRRQARASLRLVAADAFFVTTSWVCAVLLRYDADVPAHAWRHLLSFLPVVLAVTLVLYAVAGLYSGVLRFASVLEARQIVLAQGLAVVLLLPLVWFLDRPVPLSVPVIATVLSCGAAGALRFWSRMLRWRGYAARDTERVLVIGAGESGGALIRSVQAQGEAHVVAVVDDDPRLWGLRLHGARIHGPLGDLGRIVEESGATRAVLAIAAAGPAMVRGLAGACGELGISLSVVPPPSELLGRQVSLQDVRDLEIADLLGRAQVETDLDEIVHLVEGRRVLVTGGGGSIGSELVRQVATFGPSRLVVLDHDETHLFDATAGVEGPVVQRLADIRDTVALDKVFTDERPDIVFHAAAHKHVPLLEAHPAQAVQTNVLGTRNVIASCRRVGVRRFVFISTDKAVRPSSVMGATKLVGEHLALAAAPAMTGCAVRFGNVLGSRGSVVPTFVRQIRAGGPVTITDGRMTRYFMSIPEAVRLVLHAATLSRGGEIFMLDMGEPVRILDLAKRMIQLSGQRPGADVEIRVTSVRPGEKLSEQLHAPEEVQHLTSHPSIVRLEPVAMSRAHLSAGVTGLAAAARAHDDVAARAGLQRLLAARLHPPQQPVLPVQRTPTVSEQQ